jgi:hypothetical protein
LPALLEKIVEFKGEVSNNPEKLKDKALIVANLIDQTDDDYLVNFSISLLEACSLNDKVPGLICRILLNNLSM